MTLTQCLANEREHDKPEKDHLEFFIARKDSTKALQATAQPFDFVASLVELPVIGPWGSAVLAGRHHGREPERPREGTSRRPLIGAVHHERRGLGRAKRWSSWRPSGASWTWPGEREPVRAGRAAAATRGHVVVQPPRDWPRACGPLFSRPGPIGMDLDDCAVERDPLELDAHELFAWQVDKHPVEDSILGPPIHPGVKGVPVAEPGR